MDLQTMKARSAELAFNGPTVEKFRASLHGKLITPSDEGYDTARRVYNAMIDKRPGLIANCVDVSDVVSAVNFAREHNLTVAIRGGGHSGGGLGVCEGGLVIDLSGLKDIQVDPAARTVRVGGGCVWGEVDQATHAYGLATPSGVISTTGVGGLTLGGGLGHLTRKYGLTIDNLLSVDMVLADGQAVTASMEQYEDLFWAVRGGGGNFGVVTSFQFRLHPIHTVYAGPMLWHLDRAKEVMQWYREFITQAPENITGFFAFLKVPPGPHFPEPLHTQTMCGIVWCYTGPHDQADAVFKPIRQLAPALELVGPIPHPALQSMFDALLPPGLQSYWRADFVNELSDAAIDQHLNYGSKIPTLLSTMHLYPINGAAHRVGKNDTAFSYRDATWAEVIVGVDPDPAKAGQIKAWAVDYWEALHPYSAGGAYVNFMMDEGQERVKATYRDNYQRLASLKNKYDPTNLFHVNQNIKPAG